MIRTQVYLPKELYTRLQLRAKQAKKPTAQLIRELLTQSIQKAPTGASQVDRLAALGIDGPADFSSRIDDYLYGEDN